MQRFRFERHLPRAAPARPLQVGELVLQWVGASAPPGVAPEVSVVALEGEIVAAVGPVVAAVRHCLALAEREASAVPVPELES